MPHFFENIYGWFNFPQFYDFVVDNLEDNSHIVEIGVFAGKSIIYLAEKIKEKGLKGVAIDGVDHWCGSENEVEQMDFIESIGGDLYAHFLENIRKAEVDDIITPIRLPSAYAATKYQRCSLDFIMVDGDHFNGNCFQDIARWYPKLKNHHIIAGHDITCESVHNDVKDYFGSGKFTTTENDIWFKIKNEKDN